MKANFEESAVKEMENGDRLDWSFSQSVCSQANPKSFIKSNASSPNFLGMGKKKSELEKSMLFI
jgi:hypothetical protein